jgi:transposase
MRFVPVKDLDQQAILCLQRTPAMLHRRTYGALQPLAWLISEFNIVLPQEFERLRREITSHLKALPDWANRCVGDLLVHADRLNERIDEYEKAPDHQISTRFLHLFH